LKKLSITQLKKIPVDKLIRLVSRQEVQITKYGKPKAVMIPLGPDFSETGLKDLERRWLKWDKEQVDFKAVAPMRDFRALKEEDKRKCGNRKMPEHGKRRVSTRHGKHAAEAKNRSRGERKPVSGKPRTTSGRRRTPSST